MSVHTDSVAGLPDGELQSDCDALVVTCPAADDPAAAHAPWCDCESGPTWRARRLMIPVAQLSVHPRNVRRDLDLGPEFLASIAEIGVLVPLLITPAENEEGYWVVEGQRRLEAARKGDVAEVPYAMLDGDEADQYLAMYAANQHRKSLTHTEAADALFAAHEAGASRTRIRKATGLKAGQVKAALSAASMTADTRAAVTECGYDLNLEDLAILAEFQDDPQDLARLLDAASYSDTLEHHAQRLRVKREERAEHARLRAELEAGGLTITDTCPPGAAMLSDLRHDGEELTTESHAACPGHGAYFQTWDLVDPVYYCTDPQANGHISACDTSTGQDAASGSPAGPEPGGRPAPDDPAAPGTSRRVVIEGNRAWKAAAQVRHRWLAEKLFPRRSAPREAPPFLARQLLSMPGPLRSGLHLAHGSPLLGQITGQDACKLLEACGTAPPARLPLLMLAPVITTYEEAMTEGLGKDTWRPERYSPCPYTDAGTYLAFLASIGYELSAIERAVADGTPYAGDAPAGGALIVRLADATDPGEGDGAGAADVPSDDPQDVPSSHDVPAKPDTDLEQAAA